MNLIYYEQIVTLQDTRFWIGYMSYLIIQQMVTDPLLCVALF